MTNRFYGHIAAMSAAAFAVTWIFAPGFAPPESESEREPGGFPDVYYTGCREADAAGAAPMSRWQPGYRAEMDGDGDGLACEAYGGRSFGGKAG